MPEEALRPPPESRPGALPAHRGPGRRAGSVWLVGLAGLLLGAGCAGSSQSQKAALDQDVARDVSWELRKDARFAEVNASCTGGTVTLRGRVDSRTVEADAVRIAQSSGHGATVRSELEIRPR